MPTRKPAKKAKPARNKEDRLAVAVDGLTRAIKENAAYQKRRDQELANLISQFFAKDKTLSSLLESLMK